MERQERLNLTYYPTMRCQIYLTGPDVGTAILWVKMNYPESANRAVTFLGQSHALLDHTGDQLRSYDSSNIAVVNNPAWNYGDWLKIFVIFPSSTDKFRVGYDNSGSITWGSEQTFDGAYAASRLIFFKLVGAGHSVGFEIKRVELWDTVLSDADIDARAAYNE